MICTISSPPLDGLPSKSIRVNSLLLECTSSFEPFRVATRVRFPATPARLRHPASDMTPLPLLPYTLQPVRIHGEHLFRSAFLNDRTVYSAGTFSYMVSFVELPPSHAYTTLHGWPRWTEFTCSRRVRMALTHRLRAAYTLAERLDCSLMNTFRNVLHCIRTPNTPTSKLKEDITKLRLTQNGFKLL